MTTSEIIHVVRGNLLEIRGEGELQIHSEGLLIAREEISVTTTEEKTIIEFKEANTKRAKRSDGGKNIVSGSTIISGGSVHIGDKLGSSNEDGDLPKDTLHRLKFGEGGGKIDTLVMRGVYKTKKIGYEYPLRVVFTTSILGDNLAMLMISDVKLHIVANDATFITEDPIKTHMLRVTAINAELVLGKIRQWSQAKNAAINLFSSDIMGLSTEEFAITGDRSRVQIRSSATKYKLEIDEYTRKNMQVIDSRDRIM